MGLPDLGVHIYIPEVGGLLHHKPGLVWDEYVVPFESRIGSDVKHDVGCQGSKQAHTGYKNLGFPHN